MHINQTLRERVIYLSKEQILIDFENKSSDVYKYTGYKWLYTVMKEIVNDDVSEMVYMDKESFLQLLELFSIDKIKIQTKIEGRKLNQLERVRALGKYFLVASFRNINNLKDGVIIEMYYIAEHNFSLELIEWILKNNLKWIVENKL